jgi:uncharacterized integral membrane protein
VAVVTTTEISDTRETVMQTATPDRSLGRSTTDSESSAPLPPIVPFVTTGAQSATSGALPTLSRTRIAFAWWTLGFSVLLLVVVLIFTLQNLSPVSTRFFGAVWTIPLGLDLLLAALLGAGIAFLLGAARILQLRRGARRLASARRRA